ncbi:MAG TPA: hypothetical protein EYP34_14295 [Chromatiaceae bacterium]|nr:hypothetical protein [Chromatiaceae bacterium]
MNRLLDQVILLLFLLLSGLAQAQIRVQDDLGRTVTLPSPAARIVTLAPHATEMLLAIQAEKKIVLAASFFDYPDAMKHIPTISTLGGLDRERLLMSQPDLVIAWASGNHPGDMQWLKESGIPLFLSEPKKLETIADTLEKLGKLVGTPERGKQAAHLFSRKLQAACAQRSDAPRKTAYYEIWPSPPMTIGGRHWLNEVLELARLHNVFAKVPRAVFTVSAESLLSTPYQVLITSQPGTEHPDPSIEIITVVPAVTRPGPRIVEGVEQLCRQL